MTRKANHRNKVKSRGRKVSKVSKGRNNTKRTYKKQSFIQRGGALLYDTIKQLTHEAEKLSYLNLGKGYGFPAVQGVEHTLKQIIDPAILRSDPLRDEDIINTYTFAIQAHKTVLSMDAITLAIHKMARQNPIWIPDSDSPHCKLCGRHDRTNHCYYCGWVVCSKCSPGVQTLLPPGANAIGGVYPTLLMDRWFEAGGVFNDDFASIEARNHQVYKRTTRNKHMAALHNGIWVNGQKKQVCNLCYVFAPAEIEGRLRAIFDRVSSGLFGQGLYGKKVFPVRLRVWPQ
jgi:hypothetical protein